jgi:hypothetical protein
MLALESCLLTGMGKPIAYYAEPMDVFERKVIWEWDRAWAGASHPSPLLPRLS